MDGLHFYIGFSRDLGLGLYDITYKGRRIIYELGLQEAMAHYAGNDPYTSGTSYFDSYYGFGSYVYQLIPGFDCPEHATYLETLIHEYGTYKKKPSSICLFEQDAGYLLQRHTAVDFYNFRSQNTGYASATKNTIFTVRSVSSVDNYDYIFDYIFYLDGSIEVKARASGYIQGAHYANNEDYGYHIHEALSGSMHTHVMTFKADLDILGKSNSFEKVSIVERNIE